MRIGILQAPHFHLPWYISQAVPQRPGPPIGHRLRFLRRNYTWLEFSQATACTKNFDLMRHLQSLHHWGCHSVRFRCWGTRPSLHVAKFTQARLYSRWKVMENECMYIKPKKPVKFVASDLLPVHLHLLTHKVIPSDCSPAIEDIHRTSQHTAHYLATLSAFLIQVHQTSHKLIPKP